MTKPHIHNLITNLLTTEVTSHISLVVSWRSLRLTILLNCINIRSEVADNDNDDGDETRVSSWFVNFEEEEAMYVSR